MPNRSRRQFGDKISFKSLSCAPINELGVVYLFGLLSDVLDFRIESIQAGFPDCIARRSIGHGRWEELRIEFEFKSLSFAKQRHDPDEVDMIVCWKHNWQDCPKRIEVIELSSQIRDMERISRDIKEPRRLSEYNRFCRERRRHGLTFAEIGRLWRGGRTAHLKTESRRPLTGWQKFCQEKRPQGLTFREIGRLWRQTKARNDSGRAP